jgi:hypothetical protein
MDAREKVVSCGLQVVGLDADQHIISIAVFHPMLNPF